MRRGNPGRGVVHHGNKRIVVSFDPETFSEIREMAVSEGVSFGEIVRHLVEWGLMDYQQRSE